MNAYALGQMDAVRSFLKEADYADSLADVWGKVAPKKTPLAAQVAGGIAGAVPGAAVGAAGGGAAGWFGSPNLKLMPDAITDALKMKHPMGRGPTDWSSPEMLGEKIDSIYHRTAGGAAGGAALGGAAGAYGGVKATDAAYQALVKNRRAAGIRKVAPKATLALGATAAAAALANHFLSKKDE